MILKEEEERIAYHTVSGEQGDHYLDTQQIMKEANWCT